MDRRETHCWWDGLVWHLYTERDAEIARFTKALGPPTRLGRDGSVAWWDGIDKARVKLRALPIRPPRRPSPRQVAASEALAARARALKAQKAQGDA